MLEGEFNSMGELYKTALILRDFDDCWFVEESNS